MNKFFIGNFLLVFIMMLSFSALDFVDTIKVPKGSDRLEVVHAGIAQPINANLLTKTDENEFQRVLTCRYLYVEKENEIQDFFDNTLEHRGWKKVNLEKDIQRYLKSNVEILLFKETKRIDDHTWVMKIGLVPYMKNWDEIKQKILFYPPMSLSEKVLLALYTCFALHAVYCYIVKVKNRKK